MKRCVQGQTLTWPHQSVLTDDADESSVIVEVPVQDDSGKLVGGSGGVLIASAHQSVLRTRRMSAIHSLVTELLSCGQAVGK